MYCKLRMLIFPWLVKREPFLAFLLGLGLGAIAIARLPRPMVDSWIADDAAIIRIDRPDINSPDVTRDSGLDDAWQREINNAAFIIRDRAGTVLSEPDVHQTSWYGRFNDEQERFAAFDTKLRVMPIPGTSLIVIGFDAPSTSDARTIANMVVRHYQDTERAAQIADGRDTMEKLSRSIMRLRRQEDDLKLAIEEFRDDTKVVEQQLELEVLRDLRQNAMRELEDERLRMTNADACPVKIVRYGIATFGG